MPRRVDMHSAAISTLKKRKDFLAVSAKGKKFITGSFIMLMLNRAEETEPAIRIGYTVTKKMGNAVMRNFIKRRAREAVRQIAPISALQGHDYVLIARNKAADCSFSELLRELEFGFSRIVTSKTAANDFTASRKKKPKPQPVC